MKLLLNGKSLGKKRVKNGVAVFQTRYAPGELTAVAYDGSGRETGRSQLYSSVGQAKVRLEPENMAVRRGEVVFVPVTLAGANGMRECAADSALTATVDGGELLAFGSANPSTEERFDVGTCTTYYGRALAVVRAGKPGKLAVTLRDGGTESSAVITVEP